MEHLGQLSGVRGAGPANGSHGLAEQLGGSAMDLGAFDLKVRLTGRSIMMGIATAFLRVLSDAARRANEIMKA